MYLKNCKNKSILELRNNSGDFAVARPYPRRWEIIDEQRFLPFLAFPVLGAGGKFPFQSPWQQNDWYSYEERLSISLWLKKAKTKQIHWAKRPIFPSGTTLSHRPLAARSGFWQSWNFAVRNRDSNSLEIPQNWSSHLFEWTERSKRNLSLFGCTTGRCDKSWLVSKIFTAAAHLRSALKYLARADHAPGCQRRYERKPHGNFSCQNVCSVDSGTEGCAPLSATQLPLETLQSPDRSGQSISTDVTQRSPQLQSRRRWNVLRSPTRADRLPKAAGERRRQAAEDPSTPAHPELWRRPARGPAQPAPCSNSPRSSGTS